MAHLEHPLILCKPAGKDIREAYKDFPKYGDIFNGDAKTALGEAYKDPLEQNGIEAIGVHVANALNVDRKRITLASDSVLRVLKDAEKAGKAGKIDLKAEAFYRHEIPATYTSAALRALVRRGDAYIAADFSHRLSPNVAL